MKKNILIGLGVLLVVAIGYFVYAFATTRSHSPSETVESKNEKVVVKVTYCKPFKKDRLIFGQESEKALVPYGKYWRLGANEATEITFGNDVLFSGKPLQKGTYRMYAIPGADKWQVVLNSELGKWGYNEPDYTKDILRVEVASKKSDVQAEQFNINFNDDAQGVLMNFAWDNTLVQVPISPQ